MTRAEVGTPLSEVASQADQFIRYKCKKGDRGRCEVQVNGKWVRTCVATVPYVEDNVFEVTVKLTMMKGQGKASKFYSLKSFVMGWYNNILGMVGFVKTSATEGKNFRDRLDGEDEVARLGDRKEGARLAAEGRMGVIDRIADLKEPDEHVRTPGAIWARRRAQIPQDEPSLRRPVSTG